MASLAPSARTPRHTTINLLRAIIVWCDAHEMAVSQFGRAAIGDPGLISGIRRGRTLRPRTVERVLFFTEGR